MSRSHRNRYLMLVENDGKHSVRHFAKLFNTTPAQIYNMASRLKKAGFQCKFARHKTSAREEFEEAIETLKNKS